MQQTNFQNALYTIQNGRKIARKAWEKSGKYLSLQKGRHGAKIDAEVIKSTVRFNGVHIRFFDFDQTAGPIVVMPALISVTGSLTEIYIPSFNDLFANDWVEVD